MMQSKRFINVAKRSNMDVESRATVRQKAEEQNLRRKAKWISGEVMKFWQKVTFPSPPCTVFPPSLASPSSASSLETPMVPFLPWRLCFQVGRLTPQDTQAERVVTFKVNSAIREKKNELMSQQLSFLMGQTERYSTMLASNLRSALGTLGSSGCRRPPQLSTTPPLQVLPFLA